MIAGILALLRAQALRLAVAGGVLVVAWLALQLHDRRVFAAGAASIQKQWDADKTARANAELVATATRLAENAADSAHQLAVNESIKKGYEDEIAAVRRAGADAGRLRVGPAICGEGLAGQAEAGSAGRGDAPDPGTRVLPEQVDRDIKALMLEMGEAAAAGRACQRFVRENGMGD